MKKSTRDVTYLCPRLSRNVRLTLTFLHHGTGAKAISELECDSDRECDIGSPDSRGGYSWNRELCPALDDLKKS